MRIRHLMLLLVLIALPLAVVACDSSAEQPAEDAAMEEAVDQDASGAEMEDADETEDEADDADADADHPDEDTDDADHETDEDAGHDADEAADDETADDDMAPAEALQMLTVGELVAGPVEGMIVNVMGTINAETDDGKLELVDDTGTIMLVPLGGAPMAVGDKVGVVGTVVIVDGTPELEVIESITIESDS